MEVISAAMYRILKESGEGYVADGNKCNKVVMHRGFYLIQILNGVQTKERQIQGLFSV